MDYNEAIKKLGKPSHLLGIDPLAQLRREIHEAKKLADSGDMFYQLERIEAWATITQHNYAQKCLDAMKPGVISRN